LNRFNKKSGILPGKIYRKNGKACSYEKVNFNNSFAGANGNTRAGDPNSRSNKYGILERRRPGSTHEFWDFTPASQNPGNHIQFYPTSEFNPNDAGKEVFAQTLIGTWDGRSDLTGNLIVVDLKINNYSNSNPLKYIWLT